MTGADLDWNDITVPVELPEVVDPISYQRVVENAGATWDYFPGHFDPDYAQSQGNPTIYVNTMHLAGFADRVATDWAGPSSRVVRRSLRLAGSVYAGDTMIGRGRAVAKRRDDLGGPAALPCRHRDRGDQPARRVVLPGRTHPADSRKLLIDSAFQALSGGIFPLAITV